MGIKVPHWEVEADERLGVDDQGRIYYRLRGEVYRQDGGIATSWVCTIAAWPAWCRVHSITKEAA